MTKISLLAIGLAALACSTAPVLAKGKPDKASQSFIKTAIQADLAEIAAGKLAQEKGSTDAVRSFGEHMVKDHTENKAKADQVAKELNVTPPTGPGVMNDAEYLKLKILTGTTFDGSFVRSMVADHKKVIQAFEKQAGRKGPAGAFAKESLPTLKEHLKMAQSLAAAKAAGH